MDGLVLRAGVIIVDEGSVLLVKMNKKRYQFPSGSIEANESAQEAAIRETKEETGLDVETISFAQINEYVDKNTSQKSITYYFEATCSSFEQLLESTMDDEDLLEPIWVPLNELKNISLHPKNVVNSLVNKTSIKPYNVDYKG